MKSSRKNFISCAITLMITLMALPFMAMSATAESDAITITVSAPSSNLVHVGGTVTYVVAYCENAAHVSLGSGHVATVGFTANISVSGEGNERIITLANVQGNIGSDKYIRLSGGTAISGSGIPASTALATIPFSISDADGIGSVPSLTVSTPSKSQVRVGGSLSFMLTYNGDVRKIDLNAGDIATVGFSADISISGSSNTRTVTLANVQGAEGYKYIMVSGGTAWDNDFGVVPSAISTAFQLESLEGETNFSTEIDGFPFLSGGGQYLNTEATGSGSHDAVITYASIAGGGADGRDANNLRVRIQFLEKPPRSFSVVDNFSNVPATLIDKDEDSGAFVFLLELPTLTGRVSLPSEYFESFHEEKRLQIVVETDVTNTNDRNPSTGVTVPFVALAVTGAVALVSSFRRNSKK